VPEDESNHHLNNRLNDTCSITLYKTPFCPYATNAGFPLSFDTEIQGMSRTLKFHFQGPILDGSLQHDQ